jgi:hypothetical protein
MLFAESYLFRVATTVKAFAGDVGRLGKYRAAGDLLIGG